MSPVLGVDNLMVSLSQISGPADVQALSQSQAGELADDIRRYLIDAVCRTGGHLGPNLGVVELTLAIHRVFNSPTDRIVFDTGHQAYVHKLLTGRGDFSTLRQQGGLSGYPSRAESPHDIVENSHASTSLSWADGIARAHQLRGETERHVVAVIGDGALTGGMAWEALNNIAANKDRKLLIVINDNERSYARTIGALSLHLSTLRTAQGYERIMKGARIALQSRGKTGQIAYDRLRGVKKGVKDLMTPQGSPQGIFEDLGMKYLGPVDGHDLGELEHVLRRARDFGQPVIVHAITCKGKGFSPAENDEADRFHARGAVNPVTGLAESSTADTWTEVFGTEILQIAEQRQDVVGVTAAMLIPVGLQRFAAKYPQRVIDVGIAEQHAVTSAAGLAFGGLHPVVAIYATFMNRAFDQVLMDCALHRAGVTFVLDRAGITGDDGPSHHGMWDLSLFGLVPGIRIAAPRDGAQLRALLREAVAIDDGPTLIRFPKGSAPADIPAQGTLAAGSGVEVLRRSGDLDVLLVAVGAMAGICLEAADILQRNGIGVTAVDPRWVLPIPDSLVAAARQHQIVTVVEDNIATGGVASALRDACARAATANPAAGAGAETTPLINGFSIPPDFIPHACRETILREAGLTPTHIADTLRATLASTHHAGLRI